MIQAPINPKFWDQFQQAPTTGGITGQPTIDPGQLQVQPDQGYGFTDPGYANRPKFDPNNLPTLAPDWQERILPPGTEPDVRKGDVSFDPNATYSIGNRGIFGSSLATLGAGNGVIRPPDGGMGNVMGHAMNTLGSLGARSAAMAQIMTPTGRTMGIPREQLQEAIRRGARHIGG